MCLQRCLTFLIVREMRIKSTRRQTPFHAPKKDPKHQVRAGKMAQEAEALAANPDNLSWIPRGGRELTLACSFLTSVLGHCGTQSWARILK